MNKNMVTTRRRHWHARLFCTGLMLPAAILVTPLLAATPLTATPVSSTPGALLEACPLLDHGELAARRGGFEYAGLNFEFGANIRSYIDNQLVLESLVSITSAGVTREQLTELPASEPASTQAQQVAGSDTGVPVVSNAVPAQVPASIDLSGLRDAVGVSVNDNKGYTAALHQVTKDRIASYMINTASGRDLRQELEVRVDVANFRQFQQSARQTLLNSRFGAATAR